MTPEAAMTLSRHRSLLIGALLGLGLGLAAAPTQAQAAQDGAATRLKLTPAQAQKLFPEWRQLSLQSSKGQMAILQKLQQCVSSANTMEALQICQRQKRQAMQSQQRLQRQAMRELLKRNGITPPPSRRDGRRVPVQAEALPSI